MKPNTPHTGNSQIHASEKHPGRSILAQGIRQAFMYYGVSIMQTFVEFGVFAAAQLAMPTGIANGIAVACSGSFYFLMNRTSTFKASSNFWRSGRGSSPCMSGTSYSAPGSSVGRP